MALFGLEVVVWLHPLLYLLVPAVDLPLEEARLGHVVGLLFGPQRRLDGQLFLLAEILSLLFFPPACRVPLDLR